jgi:hypothetical protein
MKKMRVREKKKHVKKECPRKKENYVPSKLTAGGQFHPIHEIPERDFLDGALVGAGSLKPHFQFHVHFQFILKSSNKIMKLRVLFPLCYCYHNYNPQGTWVPFVLRNYAFCFSTPVRFVLCGSKKFFLFEKLGPICPRKQFTCRELFSEF